MGRVLASGYLDSLEQEGPEVAVSKHERQWERARTRVQVRVNEVGSSNAVTGFTRDISRDGLFIQMRTPFPSRTRVEVELLYKHMPVRLEGIVMHSARVPHHLQAIQASGMGVKIVRSNGSAGALAPPVAEPEPQHKVNPTPPPDDRKNRVTVGAEVDVFFGKEKRTLALHDLSASGAAFVSTSELPEAALVTMHLPLSGSGDVVEVECVPVRSRRLGEATVLAVRFDHLPHEVGTKIQAYISARHAAEATSQHD
jgi:hypothetical protein